MKTISEYAIQTGAHFYDFENPSESTMTLEDVALALSNICRWGGHCHPFFSVAQHALLVVELTRKLTTDPLVLFYALHHDDHESVRGDIPTPRKRYLKKHKQYFAGDEESIDAWLYENLLGVPYPIPEEIKHLIKQADWTALCTEKKYLKPGTVLWHPMDKLEDPMPEKFFEHFKTMENPFKAFLDTHKFYKEIIHA